MPKKSKEKVMPNFQWRIGSFYTIVVIACTIWGYYLIIMLAGSPFYSTYEIRQIIPFLFIILSIINPVLWAQRIFNYYIRIDDARMQIRHGFHFYDIYRQDIRDFDETTGFSHKIQIYTNAKINPVINLKLFTSDQRTYIARVIKNYCEAGMQETTSASPKDLKSKFRIQLSAATLWALLVFLGIPGTIMGISIYADTQSEQLAEQEKQEKQARLSNLLKEKNIGKEQLQQELNPEQWGIEINVRNPYPLTPLAAAAIKLDLSNIKKLLARGVDPNYREVMPTTALLEVEIGNRIALEELRKRLMEEPDSEDLQQEIGELEKNILEATKILLDGGADINAKVYGIEKYRRTEYGFLTIFPPDDRTALMQASIDLNANLVKLLLERGADPNIQQFAQYPLPPRTNTETSDSTFQSEDELYQMRLTRPYAGWTPLARIIGLNWDDAYAEYSNTLQQLGTAQVLLSADVPPNALQSILKLDSSDVKRWDSRVAKVAIVSLLLEHNADLDLPVSDDGKTLFSDGSTPLMLAVSGYTGSQTELALIRLLLEHGANPNLGRSDNGKTQNSDGSTPLISASGGTGDDSANLEIAKLLLEHGADPNLSRSDNGRTPASSGPRPLIIAVDKGYLEIAKLLLENGADPNLGESGNGLTPSSSRMVPLQFAVGGGAKPANLELTKLLLEYGANPNLSRSDNGLTSFSDGANALEINIMIQAYLNGSTEVANFLLEKGAILNDRFIFGGSIDILAGHSLLSFVVSQDSMVWARWLLEHKVNPNISTEHGTPLEVAQGLENESKRSEMLALLKEFGAK